MVRVGRGALGSSAVAPVRESAREPSDAGVDERLHCSGVERLDGVLASLFCV